jgi:ATP-dependent helicase Lhr and Lhr-like helicase
MNDPLSSFSLPSQRWFRATFGEPTAPQAAGWPAIQRGEHTLILAPTGSGKTLAAFLWSIDEIYRELAEEKRGDKPTPAGVRLLYISPLKALNNDIERNLREPLAGIRAMAAAMGEPLPPLRVAVRTGDTSAAARQAMVKQPPHILITTPESLYLILTSPLGRDMLRTARTVIVDEIHTLVGEKRGVHLTLSLERLEHLAGHPIQRIGLSATVRPLEEAARFLGGQVAEADKQDAFTPRPVTIVDTGYRKPLELEVVTPVEDFRNLPAGTIWPHVIPQVLAEVMRHRSTLIFTNNRRLAERTADRLNAQISAERSEEIPPGSTEALAPGGIARDRGIFALGAEGPIRAHHGSMSRESRHEMEEELKAGRLPALVSTGTLELGIDIGTVDFVVQLQSPKSVSQGLQRVGRAGHLVGQTSKGRIYATFREDLVEAAAVARGMKEGDVEETATPRNPLDVLAQQMLAAVSVDEWDAGALYRLVRQAYAYADLSERAWESVLAMLSGRFQAAGGPGHASLRARIAWDRENNRLAALPGARLLALQNPGTIPDTGAYDVYLADGKTKVGQLDEEFIFETRPGDTFLLGSSVWRVTSLEDNRVLVSEAAGQLPRMPFWHGDFPWRPYELGLRIGRLRREVAQQIKVYADEPEKVIAWLRDEYLLDLNSARNLYDYVSRQLDVLGGISSDDTIIVETFADAVGEARAVIHSPFGGRVNGAWSLALTDALRERTGIDVETQVNDDGILLRFPGTPLSQITAAMSGTTVDAEAYAGRAIARRGGGELSTAAWNTPAELVARLGPAEARQRILRELPNSAVFGACFRMNASRALLLPRSRGRKRTPFWLQRLKARDLLASVRNEPDFPILAETYRDCLADVMDLEHLAEMLTGIQEGRIRVVPVETLAPSPLAAGLLYTFISVYMYEWDTPKAERQLQALAMSRELVDDLLEGAGSGRVPIKPEALSQVVPGAGHAGEGRRARSADELAVILLELGDLSEAEIAARAEGDGATWLTQLESAGRVVRLSIYTASGPEARYVPAELADEYTDLLECGSSASTAGAPVELAHSKSEVILRRYLRASGPVTCTDIRNRYAFDEQWLDATLDRLIADREIVRGRFTNEPDAVAIEDQYCDRHIFEQLYRRTLAMLRREVEPVPADAFAAFLLRWQGAGPAKRTGTETLAAALEQLTGVALPVAVWQRDVLPARVAQYRSDDLDALIASGDVAWVGAGSEPKRASVRYIGRGQGALFLYSFPQKLPSGGGIDDKAAAEVFAYLKSEGASFVADLQAGLGMPAAAVRAALAQLALAGLVTGDGLDALDVIIEGPRGSSGPDRTQGSALAAELAARLPARGVRGSLPGQRRPTRESLHAARRRVTKRLGAPDFDDDGWGGRWAMTGRAALLGPPLAPEERAAQLARVSLARYGVVTPELIARSESAWTWQALAEETPPMPETPAPPPSLLPTEIPRDWGGMYSQLQRMELRGEVRRGYFVKGLSGVQFALPEAVEGLRVSRDSLETEDDVTLLASLDPANIYGGEAGGVTSGDAPFARFSRLPSTHVAMWRGRPVFVAEDSGARMTAADVESDVLKAALLAYLKRPGAPKRTTIQTWNDAPVIGSAGEALLRELGASRTPTGLEIWTD